jgi:ribosome maturation protein SDO1
MGKADIRKEHETDLFREYVVARMERDGETFEVLVKPHAVARIRDREEVDVLSNIAIDQVFRDARKGSRASEEKMEEVFGTADPLEVAEILIRKGEIQLTTEQRREMQEKKRKALVAYIAAHAINPQTGTPHPPLRIENAMREAKVHVDAFKGVEEQVKDILEELRPLIPIRFERVRIAVKLSAEDCGKCYGDMKAFGAIVKEEWQPDGTWIGVVEMPAGMQTEFLERLNAKTRGHVETRLLSPGQGG